MQNSRREKHTCISPGRLAYLRRVQCNTIQVVKENEED